MRKITIEFIVSEKGWEMLSDNLRPLPIKFEVIRNIKYIERRK